MALTRSSTLAEAFESVWPKSVVLVGVAVRAVLAFAAFELTAFEFTALEFAVGELLLVESAQPLKDAQSNAVSVMSRVRLCIIPPAGCHDPELLKGLSSAA